jgi:hypothetical protein
VPPRGRPPEFGRPAQLVALTLPQDTIESLQGVDTALGWAIVELANGVQGSDPGQPPLHMVPPGVDLVPLGHGRTFLASRGPSTVEGLEISRCH